MGDILIFVCGYNFKVPSDAIEIDTTSRSRNWSRWLSPFLVGSVNLYSGYTSLNMENAWQYSKVYKIHLGKDGEPSEEYFKWAQNGWNKNFADRYPMGKNSIPEYSYWDGNHHGYIDARKNIYIPCYKNSVYKTDAFSKLKELTTYGKDIYLKDFDGYNHISLGMTLDKVIENPNKKMGHAFVLAMMLTE